jgi:hypothetical protein
MSDSIFNKTQPCQNCPYRKDAPLWLWSIEEFKKVVSSEKSEYGRVFLCHKKDGNACVGWLIDQDRRGLPSIALRVELSKAGITREYMDKLSSPAPLYDDIEQMCTANFPELKKDFQ